MAYIVYAQIYAWIPQPKVNDALDDDGDGKADAGALDQIIANACQEVDGYLQGRYPVPFAGVVPSVVQAAAIAFACEAIAARREAIGEKNPFAQKALLYRGTAANPGLLTKIANRELPLDVSEAESITPGGVVCEEAPWNASLR